MASLSSRRSLTARRLLVLTGVWLVVAAPAASSLFATGSRDTVVAGHDAVVRPTFDGYATVDLGPYIPRFRLPSGGWLGADIDLGATELQSYDALIERYAFIASQPEGQITKVQASDQRPGLGQRGPRRADRPGRPRSGAAGRLAALEAARASVDGTTRSREPASRSWSWAASSRSCATTRCPASSPATGSRCRTRCPTSTSPAEAAILEIEAGLLTSGSQRLVESALSTYRKSLDFYRALVEEAAALTERAPSAGGRRGRRPAGQRPARQHRDGPRRARGRRRPAARRSCSTRATTRRRAARGRRSAWSPSTRRSPTSTTGTRWPATTTTETSSATTSLTSGSPCSPARWSTGPEDIRLLGASDVRSSGLGSWRDERGHLLRRAERAARRPRL